jgi:hypothetical protein
VPKRPYIVMIASTLAYWAWEARAEGNIRVDLLLIYPLLFIIYILCLWRRFRWGALGIGLLLMALNVGFFINSYAWFHKHPG